MAATTHSGFDTLALERFVLHQVDREIREEFAKKLIELALAERGIQPPDPDSSAGKLLLERVAGAEIPLTRSRAVEAVIREFDFVRTTGLVRSRVEAFSTLEEVDTRRLTEGVKDAMVKYLLELGIQLEDDARFLAGGYDEYMALAYANAVRTTGGASDPIVAARLKSGVEPWNYQVRFYDDIDTAAVVPDYIRIAGAVDYAFHIGEALRAFELAEHVVRLWDGGALDVEDQATIDRLFSYSENADARGTPERRALLYKRVLNLGKAQTGRGIVPNDAFPVLWHNLMAEAVKYIERRQEHDSEFISKRPIVHAIRDLQHNLTEFAGGGTGRAAQKLNAQLEDAMDILSAPEIVEQLSMGRRKSVWRVFQALHRDLGGKAVNVLAVRTLAEEGNRIFNFLADYGSSTTPEDFETFLESAEAWILAEAAVMGRETPEETESAADEDIPSDEAEEDTEAEEADGEAESADDW